MSDTGFYIGTERTLNSTGSVFIGGINTPDLDETKYHDNELILRGTSAVEFGQGLDTYMGKILVGNKESYAGNINANGDAQLYKTDSLLTMTALSPNLVTGGRAGGDGYGKSVAIGEGKIAVGAPDAPGGGSSDPDYKKGKAFLWDLSTSITTTTETGQIELIDPSPAVKNMFGSIVRIGHGRVAVADGYDIFSGKPGRVNCYDFTGAHLYTLTGDYFGTTQKDGFGEGNYGNSMDIGHGLIAIGAPGEDNDLGDGDGVKNTGAVYVFDIKDGIRLFKILPPLTVNPGVSFPYSTHGSTTSTYESSSSFSLGTSVAIGCGKLVIGDSYASSGGWVHVYDIYGNYERSFNSGKGGKTDNGDNFGSSLDVSGGYIIVGTYYDDDGGTQGGNNNTEGSITIFDLNGNEYATIDASEAHLDMRYGWKVSITGGKLVVSAPYYSSDNPPVSNSNEDGAVFVYDFEENTDTMVDRAIHGYKY